MTLSSLTLAFLAFFAFATRATDSLVRKNVDSLTEEEVLHLQSYLRQLEDDLSDAGFQNLVAGYHGEPSMCTDSEGHPVACCIHGMATFPQWHRLYVAHFEQALVRLGLADIGVPYWDWTQPLHELPSLVRHQIYKDPSGGLGQKNAWFAGDIHIGDLNTETARAVDDRLFEHVPPGGRTQLFNLVLDALEQEDYCQFEVQFEVAHNHIHNLVGGRHLYSMSTLEYTSYDPIFFLHHSNVDRLLVIWQELQKKRGKPFDHADCSVELFRKNLEPFDRDSNPIQLTKTYSHAKDLFSHDQLGYSYDDLTLNGMSVDQLYTVLEQRKARERAFAVFALHGLGFSANVRVTVCEGDRDEEEDQHTHHHCEFAGDFFILGGANEMPWSFILPYYFDITDAVKHLEVPLNGHYHVVAEVFSVNGTSLGTNVLSRPYGSYRPPPGHTDPAIGDGTRKSTVVRQNVNTLTDEQVYALRQAMSRFQNDTSVDGFQAVAEFHGLPAKCPHPDAAVRYACCIHGMATFPHWHRLFVVEVEDELRSRGLDFGIPYWDWTVPNAAVPALAADFTYTDPHTGESVHNPFHDASVAFLGEKTSRQVQTDELSKNPGFGDHTPLLDAMLLAFEETDYCDFEVQLEVVHNAIHFLVGGYAPYSMTTLHYSAFDPIFYLHHSSVDRLWAIWQKLQMLRGLPYKADCASSMTHELLKPFGFPPPWNNDEKTFSNARPTNVYDYESVLDYTYDTLQFGGMTVEQLQNYLEERQTRDRTFVGIQLQGIGGSAWVKVSITAPGGEPYNVGSIGVLGGEQEMPWRFNRLFKLEITKALSDLGLNYDDEFEVHLDITDQDNNPLPENTFGHDTILHQAAKVRLEEAFQAEEHVRSDINSMTAEQIQNFRDALQSLMADSSIRGYNHIAAFHGQPNWCPTPDAEHKLACCAHGMAIFPHWHRLLTVQAENALHEHGFHDGIPYWDWTLPMTHLPTPLEEETYVHPESGQSMPNPLHHGEVDGHRTSRNLRTEDLFEVPAFGELTKLADQVMLAFEQTDFCDFEVQFEVVHNDIHILVGGPEMYSMASLRFTAYDPIFFLHHSMTDRIWATWQALQKYRGLPYNSANCAIASLREPMQPFAMTNEVNPDHVTRDHSVPFDAFDYRHSFHYRYDNLQFNGLSVPQIQREVIRRQRDDRVFAGFMLHGIGKSALVVFDICQPSGDCTKAGEFYLLGDEYEIPWRYDRLYKYEITKQLKELHLQPKDNYSIHYVVHDLSGAVLSDDAFGKATVVYSHGAEEVEQYVKEVTASSHVRRNLEDLSKGDAESLKQALGHMMEDGSFEHIARFHGHPGLCQLDNHAIACCIHGSPIFPHWHRLYMEQMENALLAHGSAVSMPYWDWTQPISKLPALFHDATYFNSRTSTEDPNPFFRGKVSQTDKYTTRDPRPELFNSDYFLDNVLLALEQTSFCDFEIQFEIVHNAIHSWLGGRGEYSMSSLDYSSFDPVFFLYHSNTDRIWAIWQALQTYRGLASEESDCALNLMRKPLEPFNDRTTNQFHLTSTYSLPIDLFDYSGHLDYHYDTLKLNGWTIPQLEEVLKQRRSRDRVFAGFLLHNIGSSADIEINVCVAIGDGGRNCDHPAGVFSLLGGHTEMPFTFDRLYKFDISDTVKKLGLPLDSAADFSLQMSIKTPNGSYIDSSLLHRPSIIFETGEGKHQDEHGHTERRLVRKNVLSLSPSERRSLVLAMKSLQEDDSADGFQSLAAFHALPPLCPNPEANVRYACCIHGMATFPQWHRLYTVQMEDALRRHGALVGIPYFDTLEPIPQLPEFFTDAVWHDYLYDTDTPNPWAGADIEFEGVKVARDVQMDQLSKSGEHGYDTWSWKQFILALEQENYCDFEIQFEIAHNAIHMWLGGSEKYSMSHLHYASYDPSFYLYHANTDRIFALWQALQKYRGHDANEVNCAMEMMREPLKPFSFGAPYNLNPTTKEYSRPEDAFDYQAHFNYEYDKLELQGMDVARLQNYINERKEKNRVFAGFLLSGFGSSAHVEFSVCTEGNDCTAAGDIYILGGSAEMPWTFDRLYKYEITDVLEKKGMDVRDPFHITLKITALNGTILSSDLISEPSIIFEPKSYDNVLHEVTPNKIRHNLNHLNERDMMNLKAAMMNLQRDQGADGYQSLAAFHGAPAMCPSPQAAEHACCVHGMPTFPHWHRLYTVEMEDALVRHGSSKAMPYWDWTFPMEKLPDLFTSETYYDAWRDEVLDNPFARGFISSVNGYTVRDPQPELLKLSKDGKHSVLLEEVLLALEQTDYCSFEVQFEVTHNAIHYIVGGRQKYSLASLEYSSYDPIFFVHHTFVDKIWAVWQELQKRRGLPHNRADCAANYMHEKLHPFDWEEFNRDVRTRSHSIPQTVFRYEELGYRYDNMEIGGLSLDQIEELIHERQSHARVFVGAHLHGIGTSADVIFHICKEHECFRAGKIFILGGPLEMPWTFDRLFKYDVTDILLEHHILPDDVFNAQTPIAIKVEIHAVNGSAVPASSIPAPTIIYEPAHGAAADQASYAVAASGVRKDINSLTPEETKSLRDALRHVQEGHASISYQDLAAWHGHPGQCQLNGQTVACCHHGMASFPQWHRLYVRALEVVMSQAGSRVGIPYWDWTEAFTELPALVSEENNNPFHHGVIDSVHQTTSRAPRPQLFRDPEHGDESFFYRQVMLAFEQRDYCDFEVQFEVIHNAIHSWIGGTSPYGMSTLEFTSYDPIFFIHHSNVDRQFAIWQALQKHRGLDYNTANCNIQELRLTMEPFDNNRNPVTVIREHARAIDAFDYQKFNYRYDNLKFHGLSIPELDELLEKKKAGDRVFANFMLHGIRTSADVEFDLCDANNHCEFAGTFAILGGPLEMPWRFDRLFKYDVTAVFNKMHLRPDSDYHFRVNIRAVNGTDLDSRLLISPSVSFVPGKHVADDQTSHAVEDSGVRKDINSLTPAETKSLRDALRHVQEGHASISYQDLAAWHGHPGQCQLRGQKVACCHHGMASFPQWHRLYVRALEVVMGEMGSKVGIPYWDWTEAFTELPALVTEEENNPFHHGVIDSVHQSTSRAPRPQLFRDPEHGDESFFYRQVMLAFEQRDYCDFEVQFEVIHNAIHSWIGGTSPYGMSTLEFTSYDPIFFIHHSNVDRQFAIWQALQKYRGLDYNSANCNIQELRTTMEPFDSDRNPVTSLREHARAIDAFDYRHFDYKYDNLNFHGLTIPELDGVLEKKKDEDRVFANFMLHGIRTSADVEFDLCDANNHCEFAGTFAILGGPLEMPWRFDRLFKYDVTAVFNKMHLRPDSEYHFRVRIMAVNGTELDSHLLPAPSVSFVPGRRAAADQASSTVAGLGIRKDINTLTPAEVRSLRDALHQVQEGHASISYQDLAAWHGHPGECQLNGQTVACCHHGMASFPQWHRLYVRALEVVMSQEGARVGIPYWDWTEAFNELPALVTDDDNNPFHHGVIDSVHQTTSRAPRPQLFRDPEQGDQSFFYRQVMLAFEQRDYCDFEVQFEVIHNAIHSWVGGRSRYGMSTLEFTSYDPFFFIHHSNVDRQFAIWQALQKHRGLDYNTAYCNIQELRTTMEPFDSERNPIAFLREHARAIDAFDYDRLNYQYDNLNFHGLSIPELDELLNKRKAEDRVFANFMLHGIFTSADVEFDLCNANNHCEFAGTFAILGGPLEMPWRFDRLFKYDVTAVFNKMHLRPESDYHFRVRIMAVNGTELDSHLLPAPSVSFVPGRRIVGGYSEYAAAGDDVRKDINSLTMAETKSLRDALRHVQEGHASISYQDLAAWHGHPGECQLNGQTVACCHHGMASFPQWHRLYVRALEVVMSQEGARVGIPYWDWTEAFNELPALVTEEDDNPFHHGVIDSVHKTTSRAPRPQLFRDPEHGDESFFYRQVMLAFEQRDYCDFEVQFEVIHNAIHSWVGGRSPYGMSTLEFTSYDPFFFIHHSNVDRQFAIWQALQKYRGLDYNTANCNIQELRLTMEPFDSDRNPVTSLREHARAIDAFDYEDLHYHYDNLNFHGHSIPELDALLEKRKSMDRVFANFLLHGIRTSADVEFDLCDEEDHCEFAGTFAILGGPLEMPWRFDRLFKYDVTAVFNQMHLRPESQYHFRVRITAVNGTLLDSNLLNSPSVSFVPGSYGVTDDETTHAVEDSGVRKDINSLTPAETKSLRDALRHVQEGHASISYQDLAAWHGHPGECQFGGQTVACCHHGMASFPQWHRLYVRALEVVMGEKGSKVGIPYWDWTEAFTELPALVTEEENNPFHHGVIESVHQTTSRAPRPQLFRDPEQGDQSFFYRQVMLAFEQRDYCDFEVQFEVIHNAIHSWVGGRSPYGMSTLEFTSYDPFFFIHHSNVDRQFAIWQALQKYRGLDYNTANCNIQELRLTMEPFDSTRNPVVSLREHARAIDAFDYEDLHYRYDNLNFHGLTIPELEQLLEKRKDEDRIFANFMLHGIFTSADVEFDLCDEQGHCEFAGTFAILGGPLEMPWQFDRLFKYDVTAVFNKMHLRPESDYHFRVRIKAVNGTDLDPHLLEAPSISFEPGRHADVDHKYAVAGVGVRKDINSLSQAETKSLRDALHHVQEGHASISYQDLAAWHGHPGECQLNGQTVACCHHGMASFPQWHRLYVRALEVMMSQMGSLVGIPYWDWTEAFTELPALVTQEENNPFHHGVVESVHQTTSRAPRPQLFRDPEQGDQSFFYRQVMLAFEQRDYCDFEVQFEVIHNAIHSWIGGPSRYGMSTLEFTSYDPFFFIHHSNVDRQFAIWQALQRYRGLDYNTANCNIQELRMTMEPFDSTRNPIVSLREHARAIDAFDYDHFDYQYDNLRFHGLSIPELDELLEKKKDEDRVFANFMLHGIFTSADVEFDLCDAEEHCEFAGTFAILGGPLEMPWRFDRLFKYDVTSVFRQMHLRPDSEYHFRVRITAVNGTELDSHLLDSPSVSFVPGRHPQQSHDDDAEKSEKADSNELTRYEVSELSLEQVSNLRNALTKLQNDEGPNSFEAIAGFHGAPGKCPQEGDDKISCCRHGMPAFPHWHRLLVVQFERALKEQGAVVGVPYWDWTRPIKALPSFLMDPYDSNPFLSYHIRFNNENIVRDVQDELFQHSAETDAESLFHQALEALEEDNYCDFEVHYEIVHNAIHELVGGSATYSMATLDYSAFDPLFMVHHASVDRLWQIWQNLQKLRHKPFNSARCAGRDLLKPLEPFSYDSVNTDAVTRVNSLPVEVFDTTKFHYHYDNLNLNGHSMSELQKLLKELRSHPRVFAGFILHGFGASAAVHVDVMAANGTKVRARSFYVLGGPDEMPWAYERPYKVDITEAMQQAGLSAGNTIPISTTVVKYDGTPLDISFRAPVIIERGVDADHDVVVFQLSESLPQPYKVRVKRGTHVRFHAADDFTLSEPGFVRELGSYANSQLCIMPPGSAGTYAKETDHALQPGTYFFSSPSKEKCLAGHTVIVAVDDE